MSWILHYERVGTWLVYGKDSDTSGSVIRYLYSDYLEIWVHKGLLWVTSLLFLDVVLVGRQYEQPMSDE